MKKLVMALLIFFTLKASAQECTVAVAANAHDVTAELIAAFGKTYPFKVKLVSSASGTLNAQIRNGAPYDIFMAADTSYTQQLYKQGFTINEPVIYAIGKLVLCSTQLRDLTTFSNYLSDHSNDKIAIANPEGAPYGKAAIEYLQSVSLLEKIKSSIIYGTSISQVNIYILSGSVAMGFTSLSFVRECQFKNKKIYFILPDQSKYHPIAQGMVLLKQGAPANRPATMSFYAYLQGKEARLIFKKYGYAL